MRDHGAMGISWFLLVFCFALALSPAPESPESQTASGQAEVELETDSRPPVVALTFDDGPRADTTGRLLDELARREVPATFFLVGNRIEGQEALIRRMAEEGHQIGVHTFDHVLVTGLSRQDFDLQVNGTRELLENVVGEGTFWLRPPYGIADGSVQAWAGSPVILWSVDPEDWKDHDTDRITSAVLSCVEDGDIILMHDIYSASVDAAVQIVDALLERGYCFATVENLLAWNGVEAEDGGLYRSGQR